MRLGRPRVGTLARSLGCPSGSPRPPTLAGLDVVISAPAERAAPLPIRPDVPVLYELMFVQYEPQQVTAAEPRSGIEPGDPRVGARRAEQADETSSGRAASPGHDHASDNGVSVAPRAGITTDDTSHDNVRSVPRDHHSDDHMSSAIDEIEARIERIEAELARSAPLVLERDRLLRARAALVGEPPPPALGARRRVTRDDVAAAVKRHPGSRAGEIARALGVGQPAVSAHLYRGKDTRFESRGGRWFVRGN